MALNAHTQAGNSQSFNISDILSAGTGAVLKALAVFGTKAQGVLRAMQVAQMASTLSKMSDRQLADIGITRSDIPRYAKTLTSEA